MHGNTKLTHVDGALYQQKFADGALYVAAFGRHYVAHGASEREPNWSFRLIGEPDSPIRRFLPAIAEQLGVKRILAPVPTAFNGMIIDADELTEAYPFGNDVVVYRNKEKPADGVLIEPGEAFALTSSGCANLIGRTINPHTRETVRVGVAHMGLKSIMDNHVAANLLTALGDDPENSRFYIKFAIDPSVFIHEWDREKDGERNRNLCMEAVRQFGSGAVVGFGTSAEMKGQIDLIHMGRSELLRLGVPRQNIHCGMSISSDHVFYTTRDGSKKSNLILVTRYK